MNEQNRISLVEKLLAAIEKAEKSGEEYCEKNGEGRYVVAYAVLESEIQNIAWKLKNRWDV